MTSLAKHIHPNIIKLLLMLLTGDARLEFLRRLKMRERIERAG